VATTPSEMSLLVTACAALVVGVGASVAFAADGREGASPAASVATALVPTAGEARYDERRGGRAIFTWNRRFVRRGFLDGWDGNYTRRDVQQAELLVLVYRTTADALARFAPLAGRRCERPCRPTSVGIAGTKAVTITELDAAVACVWLHSVRRTVLVTTHTCGSGAPYTLARARTDGLRLHRLVHHNAFRLGL